MAMPMWFGRTPLHAAVISCRVLPVARARIWSPSLGELLSRRDDYENNYGGAVNRLNAITAQLAELDFAKAPGFVINGLKREELIASNSMILHELFFASLGDESAPEGELLAALTRDFGSLDRWRAEFSAMGKAQGGGSGWVLLTWSPRDRKLINQWAMDHTTTLAGATPILALDMYEHSYHMDYGARAAAYVDAFMAAINWPNVARAYGELRP
jgi:Fe-Mn family superoxide dismutase